MITSEQIRMARAGLGWTIDDLSSNSGVSSRTIKRVENAEDILSTNMRTIANIKSCLEAAGIEFIGTPDDGPGVRVRTAAPKS